MPPQTPGAALLAGQHPNEAYEGNTDWSEYFATVRIDATSS